MISQEAILELVSEASAGGRVAAACDRMAAEADLAGDHDLASAIREAARGDLDDLPNGLQPLKVRKSLDQIYLAENIREAIDAFIDEQRNTSRLVAAGLSARNKLLMAGPPGNGKTVVAGAMAKALGLEQRSFLVRYDSLISERPGETSRGIKRIIDFAATEPSVLFFDEFDALGVKRTSPKEEGDMKRAVSTLLFQLDEVPPHVVCMAATNHPELLDPALWRRFNVRLELDKPPLSEIVSFMREQFARYDFHPKEGEIAWETVDYELAEAKMQLENLSDVELFCTNVVRYHVMKGGTLTIERCINHMFRRWSEDQKKRVA